MQKIPDIRTVLPHLTTDELYQVEKTIHDIYRKRKVNIIYDDAHGVWTEDDQVSAAREVFSLMDAEEKKNEKAG